MFQLGSLDLQPRNSKSCEVVEISYVNRANHLGVPYLPVVGSEPGAVGLGKQCPIS